MPSESGEKYAQIKHRLQSKAVTVHTGIQERGDEDRNKQGI